MKNEIEKYINRLQSDESFGAVIQGSVSNGVHELPYVRYDNLANDFAKLFAEILVQANIEKESMIKFFDEHFAGQTIDEIDISRLNKEETLSLLATALKVDSAEEGILYSLYTSGKLQKALLNLL